VVQGSSVLMKVRVPSPDSTAKAGEEVFDSAERTIALTCDPHPRYAASSLWRFLDYALCYLSSDFPALLVPNLKVVEARFERLSLDRKDTNFRFSDPNTRRILLSGYGCSTTDETKRDGKFRIGFATIANFGPVRLTTGSPLRSDSAVLCAGDSGGAAYKLVTSDPNGPRVVVAVNSANVLTRNLSFLSRTSAPAFVAFFTTWREKWGRPKVCGIDPIGTRCHL
jgi:hypothetical protein